MIFPLFVELRKLEIPLSGYVSSNDVIFFKKSLEGESLSSVLKVFSISLYFFFAEVKFPSFTSDSITSKLYFYNF